MSARRYPAASRDRNRRTWDEAAALAPDLVLIALYGLDVEEARAELERLTGPAALRLLSSTPTWLLDGDPDTSRAGPRVVDGAERIRAALRGREIPGLSRWRPRR